MMKGVKDNMDEIRETLGNAIMAYTNMNVNLDGKKIVQNIFELLEENKSNIEKANNIDITNGNGFKIDFEVINKIKKNVENLEDYYRKVIYMNKNKNNYLEGKQTDNLGTICLVYDGNTYCLLELILKAILTHNSIIATSESNYMKVTNEFILILIRRILEAYKIDKNLVQILYTNQIEELLSNNISIRKVIAIGDRSFQEKIKNVSKIEVVSKGYNNFDIYIEDLKNISLIEKIIEKNNNIDVYVKKGLEIPFENYIEVEDINEAIAQINFSTSGYSSSIFTNNNQNASDFLREIKTDNISVNSSPLIKDIVDIDINLFVIKKNMFYPNPLVFNNDKNKVEIPTARAILEKNNIEENKKIVEEMKIENSMLRKNNEKIERRAQLEIEKKNMEVNELKKQLNESQKLANKYINIFKKSLFTRLFGGIKKEDIENDTKLLS